MMGVATIGSTNSSTTRSGQAEKGAESEESTETMGVASKSAAKPDKREGGKEDVRPNAPLAVCSVLFIKTLKLRQTGAGSSTA